MANHWRRKRLDYFFEELLLDINFYKKLLFIFVLSKITCHLSFYFSLNFQIYLALPFMVPFTLHFSMLSSTIKRTIFSSSSTVRSATLVGSNLSFASARLVNKIGRIRINFICSISRLCPQDHRGEILRAKFSS